MTYGVLPKNIKSALCDKYLDYDYGCGGCPLCSRVPLECRCRRDWKKVEFNPAEMVYLLPYDRYTHPDYDDKTVNDMKPENVDKVKAWIREHVRPQVNSGALTKMVSEATGVDLTNNQLKQLMFYYGYFPKRLTDVLSEFNIQLI